MKRVLIIITVFLLVTVSLFLLISHFGTQYDNSSKNYINKIVPDIISNWDSNLFYDNSNKLLLKEMNANDIENYMNMFRNRLGTMTNFKGCNGESNIKMVNFHKMILAEYICNAEFEKGEAKISIRIMNENDKWSILYLKINSDIFSEEVSNKK
jgi:hypothetical protein